MRFENPPPEPLASAVGFLLTWNGQRMAMRFAAALEPLGIRPPHFGILSIIESDPGVTQRELVGRVMIDPSSMVALLDSLEEMGLAERRENPDDRRKHAVHLTSNGTRTLGRARTVANELADEIFGPLDPAERETLRLLLRKVAGIEPEAG